MGSQSIFGGGWSYKYFSRTDFYNAQLLTPGAGGIGAWVEINPSCPDTRWIELKIYNNANALSYAVQLGLGAAGAETQWNPVGGGINGFLAEFSAAGVKEGAWSYSFPTTLAARQRVSARAFTIFNPASSVWVVVGFYG